MAFKIVDDSYGQLTFMRIYQGTVSQRPAAIQPAHGPQGALQPPRADARRQTRGSRYGAGAGDIVAVLGIDAASGDTYAHEPKFCTLESIFVPEPVIKVAVQPLGRGDGDKLGKASTASAKKIPRSAC